MYCPKCGKENPQGAQVCSGCSSPLPGASAPAEQPITKISGLAIAAFVLGILSLFTLGLTAIPAVVLGIISLVRIEKSGGRLTGIAFAVVGIVLPVLVCLVFVTIMFLTLVKVRMTAFRMTCATNLSGIGKAMYDYANDYDDEFPRAAGPSSKWGVTANWQADSLSDAFGLKDGDGQATVSASLYLLVKYEDVAPKSFVCKGDSRIRAFKFSEYGIRDKDLWDLWDFGPNPAKHCSYSYHLPYGKYPLTTSYLPGMAVAADRNPWIMSPAGDAKNIAHFNPSGTIEQQKHGNSISHREDGQNVLFMDSHVYFEKRSYCAINDDNIYTFWDGGDMRRGGVPVVGGSQPMDRKDSFLVHDPPVAARR